MNETLDPRNPGLMSGNRMGDYLIKRIVELDEIESFFYELEHVPTGARHIHISRKDKENTFAVAFKTVPKDSTGVAHVLEHTVLCGSRKYPVRDPFFSMLKRSLSTFMNALTASDWTMYPFSTENRKDYYNLMDVYLDAAFYPNLSELSFKQEGHRIEVEDNGSDNKIRLQYKGVVYNEMKGAMSSPDQVMARSLLNALYPATTYQYNSGGEPSEIPNLTYEKLKAFHRHHYHPSNAFFYTYGDQPLVDHLDFIEKKVLNQFKQIDPKTEVPSQPRWDSPKTATYYYPLSKTENPEKKNQISLAWLMADVRDNYEVLVLTILEHILLGNPASPLRKVLIESGLGTALADGTGYDSDNRDTMFACGLQGVSPSVANQIEKMIFDTLNTLINRGIEPELVESAIHQIEFHRKEVTNYPYPYGIKLLLTFASGWFHDGDPAGILQFDTDMERLKAEIASGAFLERKLKQYFVENSHRVLLKLVPDLTLTEKENRRVTKELESIKAKLSKIDIEKLKQDAQVLKNLQESSENTAVLPTLELSDIPLEVKTVRETQSTDIVTTYRKPTAGIFYFTAAAGTGQINNNLIPLLPFFCQALTRSGTKRRDYTEVVRRIDAYTGGIGLSAQARTPYGDTNLTKPGICMPFITLSGKCLVRNLDKLFDIIAEFLYDYAFSDLSRLKNLLLEYRSGLESMIVHSGHHLAISLASRGFSLCSALNEMLHGVQQVMTIKKLTDDLSEDKLNKIAQELTAIGNTIFKRNNLKIALIGEEKPLTRAVSLTKNMMEYLPESQSEGFRAPELSEIFTKETIPYEGWHTSSAVSFVARTFRTVRMGHEDAPALSVIAKLLRSLFLHREIREKGGAYGGISVYIPENGQFAFASYRDPHIVNTLNIYEQAFGFIRSGMFTEEDIKEGILQVCSDIDKPDPPGPSARKAFYRKLLGLSDEARKQYKKELLNLSRKKILAVAEKYFDPETHKDAVAVISGEDQLEAANRVLYDKPLKLFGI